MTFADMNEIYDVVLGMMENEEDYKKEKVVNKKLDPLKVRLKRNYRWRETGSEERIEKGKEGFYV